MFEIILKIWSIKDHLKNSLLILNEYKRINFYFRWNHQKNHRFSDYFKENRSQLISLNSLNVRSEIWRRSLTSRYLHVQS